MRRDRTTDEIRADLTVLADEFDPEQWPHLLAKQHATRMRLVADVPALLAEVRSLRVELALAVERANSAAAKLDSVAEDRDAAVAERDALAAQLAAVRTELALWDQAIEPDGGTSIISVRGAAALMRAALAAAVDPKPNYPWCNDAPTNGPCATCSTAPVDVPREDEEEEGECTHVSESHHWSDGWCPEAGRVVERAAPAVDVPQPTPTAGAQR